MKQPTYIAGESPFAGINSPASITPISTEGLSSGISQYTNTAAAILEKSRQRQESLWVKEQALKANQSNRLSATGITIGMSIPRSLSKEHHQNKRPKPCHLVLVILRSILFRKFSVSKQQQTVLLLLTT